MSHSYLCKYGHDVEVVEAAGPQPAATIFSKERSLRKGAVFQVMDKLSKIRHYKVGPNPRAISIINIEQVLT